MSTNSPVEQVMNERRNCYVCTLDRPISMTHIDLNPQIEITIGKNASKEGIFRWTAGRSPDPQTTRIMLNVSLFDKDLPKTCGNFRKMCQDRAYVNYLFDEVSEEYMQTGAIAEKKTADKRPTRLIPLGDFREVEAKQKASGLRLHDEAGLLSVLRSSSKFVITLGPAHRLDNDYIVFGQILPVEVAAFLEVTKELGTLDGVPRKKISVTNSGVSVEQERPNSSDPK